MIAAAILAILRGVYVLVRQAVALVVARVVQCEGMPTTLAIVLIATALRAFEVTGIAPSTGFETRRPAVAVTIVTIVCVECQAGHTPAITVSANTTIIVGTAIAVTVPMSVLSASASATASCRLVQTKIVVATLANCWRCTTTAVAVAAITRVVAIVVVACATCN